MEVNGGEAAGVVRPVGVVSSDCPVPVEVEGSVVEKVEGEESKPSGLLSFSVPDVPIGAWVWACFMTVLWFGVCVDVAFFDGANPSESPCLGIGAYSQQSPIWCPCDLESGYQPTRLRIHKGLPTIVAGVFPVCDREQSRTAPWLFDYASHVFVLPHHNSGSAFMVVWVNFVPTPSKPIRGILPSRGDCERWLNSHAETVGFQHVRGLSVTEAAALVSAGSIERTAPVRLPPCSAEDEAILYEQNKFEFSFNVDLLRKYVSRVKDRENAQRVIDHLDSGHLSGHVAPALDQEFLDWSQETMDPDDLAFEEETIRKYAKFGYCAGPFALRPPFPNLQNKNQATCQKSFTIPKDSTEAPSPTMKRRFIVHGSWPTYASYNFLIPRSDTGRKYHTCGKFLSKVARYGKNTIVMMMDMVDCFMNFLLHVEEWHRQCVRVGKNFWVFKVGMFGSSCAGDFAENFTAFLTDIFREVFGLVDVCVYVDNFDNVVPPLPNGEPDWDTAWRQWRAMLTIAKIFRIRMHDFVEPTLCWGMEGANGVAIDSHLGWGGQSAPIPKAWLSEKRRVKFLRLTDGWLSQEKFTCTEVRQMVGVAQSLEVVLKCLSGYLSTLYAWQTRVERQVRSGVVKCRRAKVFSNPSVARILHNMVRLLEEREWSVPLIDWEATGSAEVCYVFADAATPKEFGLAYREPVWGKSAYCTFGDMRFYLAQMHDTVSLGLAKRETQLSQNFFELENYIMSVIEFVKRTGARRVHLVGDSQVAIGWIESCAPADAPANTLVRVLINAQLDLGFVLTTESVARSDTRIQRVDRMSKGDSVTMQVMDADGYVRIPWKRFQ